MCGLPFGGNAGEAFGGVDTVLHAGHVGVGAGAMCGLPFGGKAGEADGGVDAVLHAGHAHVAGALRHWKRVRRSGHFTRLRQKPAPVWAIFGQFGPYLVSL